LVVCTEALFFQEFDIQTDNLVVRKWRYPKVGTNAAEKPQDWVFEIGEPIAKTTPTSELFTENVNNVSYCYNTTIIVTLYLEL
jgi:hypothetical protein